LDADAGSGPLCFSFKGHLFDPDWDRDGGTEGCWKVEVRPAGMQLKQVDDNDGLFGGWRIVCGGR